MNPPPDLQALMALDALGEASAQQQAELKARLATEPDLSHQNATLRDLATRMEDMAGPLPPPRAVPASALARMEASRTAALARAAGAGNVVALSGAVPSNNGNTATPKTQVPRPGRISRVLAWAAALVLLSAPVGWWVSQQRGSDIATASPALAPRGETGMTQPTLVWENATGQDYDVWILPEGADQKTTPALFVANKVRSPLPFALLQPGPANAEKATALKPGTPYLALVCLAGHGRLAGVTVAFQTAPAALGAPPAPSDVATALSLIRQLEMAGRPGDALMVIMSLPDGIRTRVEITAEETRLRASLPTSSH